jgi:hypothetical protein
MASGGPPGPPLGEPKVPLLMGYLWAHNLGWSSLRRTHLDRNLPYNRYPLSGTPLKRIDKYPLSGTTLKRIDKYPLSGTTLKRMDKYPLSGTTLKRMDKYPLSGTTLKRIDSSFFRIGEGIWIPTAHSIQFVACDNEVNITCLT